MVVTNQHYIDLSQLRDGACWRAIPFRTKESCGRAAGGEDRVDEEVVLAHLDDCSRVADPRIPYFLLIFVHQLHFLHGQFFFQQC